RRADGPQHAGRRRLRCDSRAPPRPARHPRSRPDRLGLRRRHRPRTRRRCRRLHHEGSDRRGPRAGDSRRGRVLATLPAMLQVLAVIHVLLSASLVGLILMHSGRDTGLGGMGFTPASQGGTHIVERNLTRLTIVIAVLFFANTVALYRLLK